MCEMEMNNDGTPTYVMHHNLGLLPDANVNILANNVIIVLPPNECVNCRTTLTNSYDLGLHQNGYCGGNTYVSEERVVDHNNIHTSVLYQPQNNFGANVIGCDRRPFEQGKQIGHFEGHRNIGGIGFTGEAYQNTPYFGEYMNTTHNLLGVSHRQDNFVENVSLNNGMILQHVGNHPNGNSLNNGMILQHVGNHPNGNSLNNGMILQHVGNHPNGNSLNNGMILQHVGNHPNGNSLNNGMILQHVGNHPNGNSLNNGMILQHVGNHPNGNICLSDNVVLQPGVMVNNISGFNNVDTSCYQYNAPINQISYGTGIPSVNDILTFQHVSQNEQYSGNVNFNNMSAAQTAGHNNYFVLTDTATNNAALEEISVNNISASGAEILQEVEQNSQYNEDRDINNGEQNVEQNLNEKVVNVNEIENSYNQANRNLSDHEVLQEEEDIVFHDNETPQEVENIGFNDNEALQEVENIWFNDIKTLQEKENGGCNDNETQQVEENIDFINNKMLQEEVNVGFNDNETVQEEENVCFNDNETLQEEVNVGFDNETVQEEENMSVIHNLQNDENIGFNDNESVQEESIGFNDNEMLLEEENVGFNDNETVQEEENISFNDNETVQDEENVCFNENETLQEEETIGFNNITVQEEDVSFIDTETLQDDEIISFNDNETVQEEENVCFNDNETLQEKENVGFNDNETLQEEENIDFINNETVQEEEDVYFVDNQMLQEKENVNFNNETVQEKENIDFVDNKMLQEEVNVGFNDNETVQEGENVCFNDNETLQQEVNVGFDNETVQEEENMYVIDNETLQDDEIISFNDNKTVQEEENVGFNGNETLQKEENVGFTNKEILQEKENMAINASEILQDESSNTSNDKTLPNQENTIIEKTLQREDSIMTNDDKALQRGTNALSNYDETPRKLVEYCYNDNHTEQELGDVEQDHGSKQITFDETAGDNMCSKIDNNVDCEMLQETEINIVCEETVDFNNHEILDDANTHLQYQELQNIKENNVCDVPVSKILQEVREVEESLYTENGNLHDKVPQEMELSGNSKEEEDKINDERLLLVENQNDHYKDISDHDITIESLQSIDSGNNYIENENNNGMKDLEDVIENSCKIITSLSEDKELHTSKQTDYYMENSSVSGSIPPNQVYQNNYNNMNHGDNVILQCKKVSNDDSRSSAVEQVLPILADKLQCEKIPNDVCGSSSMEQVLPSLADILQCEKIPNNVSGSSAVEQVLPSVPNSFQLPVVFLNDGSNQQLIQFNGTPNFQLQNPVVFPPVLVLPCNSPVSILNSSNETVNTGLINQPYIINASELSNRSNNTFEQAIMVKPNNNTQLQDISNHEASLSSLSCEENVISTLPKQGHEDNARESLQVNQKKSNKRKFPLNTFSDRFLNILSMCKKKNSTSAPHYVLVLEDSKYEDTSAPIEFENFKNFSNNFESKLHFSNKKFKRYIIGCDIIQRVTKNLWKCGMCGENMSDRNSLEFHITSVHADFRTRKLRLRCVECFKGFLTKASLKDHFIYRHSPVSMVCPQCESHEFYNNFNFLFHLLKHICPFKIKLVSDDSAIYNMFDLPRYLIGENLYKCPICKKICPSNFAIKSHLMLHINIITLKCNKCCTFFVDEQSLRSHIEKHKPKRIKCNECNLTFFNTYQLEKHQKFVHFKCKTNVKCKICNKFYKHATMLLNHMSVTHHQKNPDLKSQAYII